MSVFKANGTEEGGLPQERLSCPLRAPILRVCTRLFRWFSFSSCF